MIARRLVLSLLALLVCALGVGAVAAPAQAAPDVSAAGAALRGGDAVYSDPAAENALTDDQVADLTARIVDLGVPMFVAVLPASAADGSSADEVVNALHEEVGLAGIYAVIVGDSFRVGATGAANSVAATLATQALRENRDAGAYAILSGFVDLVDQEANGGASGSSSGGVSLVAMLFLIGLLAAVAVVVVLAVRSSRRKTAAQLASVRATVDADVTTYGEQLGVLSVDDPDLGDAGRTDLQHAFDSYDRAKSAVAAMRSPEDARVVTEALEDGRFALACAQARMDQQPLPERRPPCFVDPRHGPSVADVRWTPPGLGERDVPLCAACRTTVESGGQPAGLQVATAGGQRPYYQAGPEYGAYAGGYFGSFAPVMSAVLVGTMLSSMWSGPAMGTPGVEAAGFGWGGGDGGTGGGGWDFGGGDFGGGGGDFGGGDF